MFQMPTINQGNRPPLVEFEWRAVLDRAKTEAAGVQQFNNVAFVKVMAQGSKDILEAPAEEWLMNKRKQAMAGSYPKEWAEGFAHWFEQFKAGKAALRDGFPLDKWPQMSPAEVAQCHAANVTTVEDLAEQPESGLALIGMGGRALRDKARAFLQAGKDTGVLVEQIGKLSADVESLRMADKTKDEKIAELEAALAAAQGGRQTLKLNRGERS